MNFPRDIANALGWNNDKKKSELVKTLTASALSKPFIILTGGSGSGKTAIAAGLGSYFAVKVQNLYSALFTVGQEVGEGTARYKIGSVSGESVTLINSTGKKIVFPIGLIKEWMLAIDQNVIHKDMERAQLRAAIDKISEHDKYYHGWGSQLLGLASAGLKKNPSARKMNRDTTSVVIPVGADWIDNRNVLGYVNHLRSAMGKPVYQTTAVLDLILEANANKEFPFFLILDEMNLSHVERYFADFLSVMEQKDGKIQLHSEGGPLPSDGEGCEIPEAIPYPDNLFVIGTVNVDETTYMFSPKVLDRANVIEFSVESEEIEMFLTNPHEYPEVEAAEDGVAVEFLRLAKEARAGELEPYKGNAAEKIPEHLVALFKILKKGRFEFAFRTSNEVVRYLRVCRHLSEDKMVWDAVGWREDLDDQIVQKLLPKLHGSIGRISQLLADLAAYCNEGEVPMGEDGKERVIGLSDAIALKGHKTGFPKSFGKLKAMMETLRDEQFVSFIQ